MLYKGSFSLAPSSAGRVGEMIVLSHPVRQVTILHVEVTLMQDSTRVCVYIVIVLGSQDRAHVT